jgi:hypothetical protein
MLNQASKHQRRRLEDYSEVMKYERASNNFFKSFIPKPNNIHLNIQDKDEKIVLVLRQHPITQVQKIFWLVLALIFIPQLLSFAGFMAVLPGEFASAFNFFWIVLAFGLLTRSFLSWFFNVYIVTDERIIDVDFHSVIYYNVSSAKIENIEDVTTKTIGPLAAVFNFGSILIQTAGEKNQFEFEHVPQPAKITKLLNELILEEEREKIEGRIN